MLGTFISFGDNFGTSTLAYMGQLFSDFTPFLTLVIGVILAILAIVAIIRTLHK